MDKKRIRKSMITYLQTIPLSERKIIEKKLTNNLLATKMWENAQTVGITISQPDEWNTRNIIEAAWKQDKIVCAPKCDPDNKEMLFYQLNSYDQLETVYYNLQEPNPKLTNKIYKEKIELLIVPGLAFDRKGYRVGFGGGYYDRFLVNYPNVTVSLLSKKQLVDQVPKDQYDLPVQHLITNNGKVNCMEGV